MNLYEDLKCVDNIFLSTSMLLSAEINGSIFNAQKYCNVK